MRSFLGPVKRAKVRDYRSEDLYLRESLLTQQQISQSPQPYVQTFSRSKSSKSDEDGGEAPQEGKLMDKLMSDLSSGNMPLDRQLQDLGVDPEKFKEYGSDYTHNRYKKGG
jgi:small subunit ribosomal protein S10